MLPISPLDGSVAFVKPPPGLRIRCRDYFVHALDPEELHVLGNVGGDLRRSLLVVERRDQAADAVPVRSKRLVLEAANREHTPAKGDLSRHRRIVAHRPLGER